MKSTKLQTGFRRWVSLVMAAVLAASLLCMGQPVVAQGLTQGDFQYQLTDDGVEITRYTGDSAKVTIPETLEEQPVVGIGPAAFALNQTIEELTLPSTLEYIGDSAFLLCENLSRIEFSQSAPQVLQAGESILRNTAWWEAQPEGLVLLGGTALGWKGKAPITLVLDGRVTAVADQAFSSNYLPSASNLLRVEAGDSVQWLGSRVFAGQSSLNSAFLSDSVTHLGEGIFSGCSPDLLLETYLGSAAEAYAQIWGIRCEAVCRHDYRWYYNPQPVLGQVSTGTLRCANCQEEIDQITFLTGDLTGEGGAPDENIDLLDVMALAQYLVNENLPEGIYLDYQGDGCVDVLDVMTLTQYRLSIF